AIDPDPDRQAVRQAWADRDKAVLRRLAEPARADRLEPSAIVLLAHTLGEGGANRDRAAAVDLLRRGRPPHTRDVLVNKWLGYYLAEQGPDGRSEAIRYYTLAYALQPATGHDLAHLLDDMGRGEEAGAIFRELAELDVELTDRTRNLACFGRL